MRPYELLHCAPRPAANKKLSPIIPVQFVTYLAGLHTTTPSPARGEGRAFRPRVGQTSARARFADR
jgi:hypothetical protein